MEIVDGMDLNVLILGAQQFLQQLQLLVIQLDLDVFHLIHLMQIQFMVVLTDQQLVL